MVKELGAAGFETMPVEEARKAFLGMVELAGPPEAVDKVEDRTLPGGPRVRVYTPAGPGPKPALIYFHGGGWVLGSPETIDAPCRRLANASGCVVVSVDYRLAPEHHFPMPLDDCYAATRYVAEHARSSEWTPGGSPSAATAPGATWRRPSRSWRATAAARRWRSSSWSTRSPTMLSTRRHTAPSVRDYGLTEAAMRWFWAQYLARPDDGENPLASPLRADLRGLPPALVMTAEFDPLRDEGEAYAARLRAAGVRVEAERYDGQLHGFFQMGGRHGPRQAGHRRRGGGPACCAWRLSPEPDRPRHPLDRPQGLRPLRARASG